MADNVIKEIIEIELEMFTSVNNVGERAKCQEDPQTFNIMRSSQAETWSDELCKSYYYDLQFAKLNNRNLLTEKYGRMMESTHPSEYEKIKDHLPKLDTEMLDKIENILKIYLEWDHIIKEKYPNLRGKGRKTHSYEDTPNSTSFETYFRGELQTYSPRTIDIYYNYVLEKYNNNENLGEMQLANTAKYYGYDSLEELNKRMAAY